MTYSKFTILAVVATVVSLAFLSSCSFSSSEVKGSDSTKVDTLTKVEFDSTITDSVK